MRPFGVDFRIERQMVGSISVLFVSKVPFPITYWQKRAIREPWLKTNHKPWSRDQAIVYRNHFQKPFEDYVDRCEGICLLTELDYRTILETSLRFFNQDRYILDAFVFMPSHVHVLVLPLSGSSLSKILHSWKSYSSLQINRLREEEGKRVWQEEPFDPSII